MWDLICFIHHFFFMSTIQPRLTVGRPKKGTEFGLKKPCSVCGAGNYEEDWRSHVRSHDLDDIVSKLEELDNRYRKCNVCKKFLNCESPTAKTYSGHPCQRRLRKCLRTAINLQTEAKKELAAATNLIDKRAWKAKLADASRNVEISKTAVAGSEDPAILRAVAAFRIAVERIAGKESDDVEVDEVDDVEVDEVDEVDDLDRERHAGNDDSLQVDAGSDNNVQLVEVQAVKRRSLATFFYSETG
jgi:hypothetical protein